MVVELFVNALCTISDDGGGTVFRVMCVGLLLCFPSTTKELTRLHHGLFILDTLQ